MAATAGAAPMTAQQSRNDDFWLIWLMGIFTGVSFGLLLSRYL
jgi:hypothetical protein